MTSVKLCAIFLFAACVLHQAAGLNVSVYYESLCPDSIRFITQQLYPAYQNLKFDVTFVPYGKAAHRLNPWSVRCQHGANECLGNMVQACALTRIQSNADQVKFVNCVMSTSYPPLAGKACAAELGLTYTGVADCSTGSEGKQLLANLGDKTHSLPSGLAFVPTIIFNDQFSQEIQNQALVNLPRAICNADPTVEGCNNLRRKTGKNKQLGPDQPNEQQNKPFYITSLFYRYFK